MGFMEDLVRTLLRQTELVDVAIEAEYLPGATAASTDSDIALGNRRILAVVFHPGSFGGPEEGSVFICKRTPWGDDTGLEDVEIDRIIPISDAFSISMAQTRRNAVDLHGNTTASILNQSQAGFLVTVVPGESTEEESLTFFTDNTQALRVLVAECKRFKDQAPGGAEFVGSYQAPEPFSWLRHYLSRTKTPQLSSLAWDIRVTNTPLHAQLSPASAGSPGDDKFDATVVQHDWVSKTAKATTTREQFQLKLRVGTFNVNGCIPSQDLSSWIQGTDTTGVGSIDLSPVSPLGSAFTGINTVLDQKSPIEPETPLTAKTSITTIDEYDLPDIFVFGFQELDLSTEALLYSTSTFREDTWTTAILAALGEKATLYEKLASKQLVGMLLVIFTKKEIVGCFSDIQVSSAAAGIMGFLGNKGGTAIRLAFTPPDTKDSTRALVPTVFTFVNAHLAAFDEMYEKRNADFQDVSRRLTFPTGSVQVMDNGNATSASAYSIYDCDVLIWLVYLNYRLDLPDQDVRDILDSQYEDKLETLLKYDQLRKAIRTKKAFEGFLEHSITHLPTYRFSPGLPTDALGYDMKRKPAWTDRVLYMHDPSIGFHQTSYTGHPRITFSDHRPVATEIDITINVYDKGQLDSIARKLYRQVDVLEHPSLQPALRLNTDSLNLGTISYRRRVSQELRLENTGKIPCAYRFIRPEDEAPLYPEWLNVEPLAGLILPGEVVNVEISAYVGDKAASELNLGPKELEWTFVVHTIYGRDSFVGVTATYEYTCFATNLDRLLRLKGSARSLTSPDDLLPEENARNAPKDFMKLINWLMGADTDLNVLFTTSADENLVQVIQECLDTGEEFTFSKNEEKTAIAIAFGATILQFLKAMPDPVIPASLHTQCAQVTNRDDAFELLEAFPPASVNVWISFTAFLHFVCQSSEDTDARVVQLAMIFAPILLRDDDAYPVSPFKRRRFLSFFMS
ncbi:DNase I-like protein [Pluteus cervinus]|uniref:DNase I-like protein n=1 Tax=Pluteus cervinus TaxID=181527 RepID=A0ACD3BC99_9AGAR|nr:DNase I-like protein [Pluteus cervinus]